MQRVKTATAVTSKPAYSESGTPGYFIKGDAVAAIPATVPGQDWYNMVQEELRNLVVAAELTPSSTDDTQLAQAVAKLIAAQAVEVENASETVAGILKLATSAQALAGTDTATAMTPADAASAINAVVSAALANVAKLNVAQGWTRQQHAVLVTRTGQSGSQAVDLDLHQALMVTATGAITIAAPDHMVAGRTCLLLLYGATAQTISWASAWHGTSLVSLPTALTAGKLLAVSFLCVTTDAGTYMVPVGTIQEA